MPESIEDYMKRRREEAVREEQARRYRMIEHSKEADELQRLMVERFNKRAAWCRLKCGLD